jgi:hypothetical protein
VWPQPPAQQYAQWRKAAGPLPRGVLVGR